MGQSKWLYIGIIVLLILAVVVGRWASGLFTGSTKSDVQIDTWLPGSIGRLVSKESDIQRLFVAVNEDDRYRVRLGNAAELDKWADSLELFALKGAILADGRPIEKVTLKQIRLVYTSKPQPLPITIGGAATPATYGISWADEVLEIRFQYHDAHITSEGFEGLVNLELLRILLDTSVAARSNLIKTLNQQIPIIRDQPEMRFVTVEVI